MLKTTPIVCVIIKNNFLLFHKVDHKWELLNEKNWLSCSEHDFLSYLPAVDSMKLLVIIDYVSKLNFSNVLQNILSKNIHIQLIDWNEILNDLEVKQLYRLDEKSMPRLNWLSGFLLPNLDSLTDFSTYHWISDKNCPKKVYLLDDSVINNEKYILEIKKEKEKNSSLEKEIGRVNNDFSDLMLEKIKLDQLINQLSLDLNVLRSYDLNFLLERHLPIFYENFWSRINPADFAHLLNCDVPTVRTTYQSPELVSTLLTEYRELPETIKKEMLSFCERLKPYDLTIRRSARFVFE